MALHIPVLLQECLTMLDLSPGMTVVDGTLGGGGHTRAMAISVGPQGCVVALDRDPQAIAAFSAIAPGNVIARLSNFANCGEVLKELDIERIDAMLVDLGLSSDQLADDARGFSFQSDGPLDLRFNPDLGEPAWQLLQHIPQAELADLIYQFGEERASRAIAKRVCEERRKRPIRTAGQLAHLVRQCVRRSPRNPIDPATRTFQALRIAVNRELESLSLLLDRAPDFLKEGGRLAVISFHSLEDRIVKQAFRDKVRWEALTKKPIVAGDAERIANPRSRSAKLRAAVLRAGAA